MKMKTYFKSILVAFLLVMFTVSCNDYLDVPVESNVTEEDVYSTYKGYQGFVDYMYTLIIDYNRHALTTTGNIGGEVIGSGTMGWTSGTKPCAEHIRSGLVTSCTPTTMPLPKRIL
jgi:starch-binding outer membrane protein, SusD/RagB family